MITVLTKIPHSEVYNTGWQVYIRGNGFLHMVFGALVTYHAVYCYANTECIFDTDVTQKMPRERVKESRFLTTDQHILGYTVSFTDDI